MEIELNWVIAFPAFDSRRALELRRLVFSTNALLQVVVRNVEPNFINVRSLPQSGEHTPSDFRCDQQIFIAWI